MRTGGRGLKFLKKCLWTLWMAPKANSSDLKFYTHINLYQKMLLLLWQLTFGKHCIFRCTYLLAIWCTGDDIKTMHCSIFNTYIYFFFNQIIICDTLIPKEFASYSTNIFLWSPLSTYIPLIDFRLKICLRHASVSLFNIDLGTIARNSSNTCFQPDTYCFVCRYSAIYF